MLLMLILIFFKELNYFIWKNFIENLHFCAVEVINHIGGLRKLPNSKNFFAFTEISKITCHSSGNTT